MQLEFRNIRKSGRRVIAEITVRCIVGYRSRIPLISTNAVYRIQIDEVRSIVGALKDRSVHARGIPASWVIFNASKRLLVV